VAQKNNTSKNRDRSHAKTDIRYWQQSIFQRRFKYLGESRAALNYSARFQYLGHRETITLDTPNRAAAAARARDIYLHLIAHGWDQTIAKYRPGMIPPATQAETVGEFLDRIKATSTIRERTIEDYCRNFRRIVAGIFDLDGGRKKFDYQKGGRDQWLSRIRAIKLADVTPERVQKWKIDYLKRAETNPASRRAARITVNSTIRIAKALFTPARLRFVRVNLPFKTPFEGIQFEPRQSMRYRSSFDLEVLIRAAIRELDIEELKVFILAAMAGLRRNEIDKLQWKAFHWDRAVLRVDVTEHLETKSEDSIGEVDLEPEMLAMFRHFHANSNSVFVITSPVAPRRKTGYSHYRCHRIFASLGRWLRRNGVKGNFPLHSLRKEYGSRICDKLGIYAASQALRHADITITSQHYIDKKRQVTAALGHLLTPAPDEP
jgi:integrase